MPLTPHRSRRASDFVLSCQTGSRGGTMALKFTDKEPEGDRSKKAGSPAVKREPDAEALNPSVDPELPHATPKSKRRQRK